MLTASQDIDSFIERQRSKLNRQPSSRPQNNRPPPPPAQQPPTNTQDRLDYKVARILDEPPPRLQAQQPYYPPPPSSPPSYTNNNNHSMLDQQVNYYPEQQRRYSEEASETNSATFFNKFGAYDDKRSQLKDDLKREYNEYLQSQRRVPKSKSTSQLPTPHAANTNKRVQFQQNNGKVVAPWERNEAKSVKNVQSMNEISSAMVTNDHSNNRSRPSMMARDYDDQQIRDRESYVGELHSQIRELEARKKQLEMGSYFQSFAIF